MSKSTDLKTLQQELQQALNLIDDYSTAKNVRSNLAVDGEGLTNTQSLLKRCANVVSEDQSNKKPTLRIIHHFACSGGTLISKCIAAQPNVFLLSELHPTTRHGLDWSKATYTPRDIVTQAYYAKVPDVEELAEKIFVENIQNSCRHITAKGGYLVIRAHSHADYCMDMPTPEVDTVTRLLSPHFEIKQLVSIRNPIDSFLSLRNNNWVHFSPNSFDEYCLRLISFLKGFNKDNIIRYEDFVDTPEEVISQCSALLDIPINEDFFYYKDVFKVSGDSGRSGVEIKRRERKEISKQYKKEIAESENFKEICKYFGYSGCEGL
ncbi:hypothetical protein [Alteromonas halophila]|uniref:Sulfotransferase family protein n=1 Tax=Alteromonas halophila TaxID=516698 RepID=A0A918MY58_9ALTE|nr:hypothetical protein [Alteromonas halophila]GGW82392.1 hypothetical protein GCM10007391_14290 [Alteromonas halophila]